jgi:hypothetical protein
MTRDEYEMLIHRAYQHEGGFSAGMEAVGLHVADNSVRAQYAFQLRGGYFPGTAREGCIAPKPRRAVG